MSDYALTVNASVAMSNISVRYGSLVIITHTLIYMLFTYYGNGIRLSAYFETKDGAFSASSLSNQSFQMIPGEPILPIP
jgi:hypothetical protein